MITVFYFLAAILIWFSFRSLLGGIEYHRFVRRELSLPTSAYAPFVTVIAPCRGLEDGLKENLTSLLYQDYPSYEVIFVVDNASDPSVSVIREIMESASSLEDLRKYMTAKLVVAPKAVDCSQKAENLREAVLHIDDRSKAFVFVDSDARPSKRWLKSLVTPLEVELTGATTGYRWFIANDPSLGSELRAVWNASVATALGPKTSSNFCWGGSMAIRRDTFERLNIREKWSRTLSDDFAVTRAMKTAGLDIVFVPQALTASIENCNFREMLEFTTRQMKITRVNAPKLWAMSLVGSGLFNTVMIASLAIIIFSRQNNATVFVAIVTLTLVPILSVGKAWLRLRAVRSVLDKYDSELKRQSTTQYSLWLVVPLIFFYNSLAALFSRRLRWRGIEYELKSPDETVIITS